MWRREFTKPLAELRALAVDRAADAMADVLTVLRRNELDAELTTSRDALVLTAHAVYREALAEVMHEHEVEREPLGVVPLGPENLIPVGDVPSAYVGRYVGRRMRSQLRPVPLRPPHANGTPCHCDPSCDCHPPLRLGEPAELAAALKRGSWHLDTCPAFKAGEVY